MLKIISFDMDGTLVSSNYVEKVWLEGMPNLYAERHGLDLEAAKQHVYDEYMTVGSDCLEWYDLPHWLDYFDLSEDPKAILDRYRDQVEIFPETEEVLWLLSQDYELVVTSNGADYFVELELAPLRHYFREMISTTSHFKRVKNSPETYRDLCRHLGVEPHEVLHVGDHRTFDYEMPKEAGLWALYLDREGVEVGPDVVADLRELVEWVKGL